MIKRHLAEKLAKAAKQYPVVSITGPRQSGKTTLVKAQFPDHEYVSLENPDDRAFALEDPRGFLDRFRNSVILDEAQRAPALFSYIQTVVDQEDRPGRFIVSGSQNFLLLHKVSQSLAGRCAVLHLLPFSRAELVSRKPFPLERLGEPPGKGRSSSAGDLFDLMFQGFYPRIHDKKLDAQDWLASYTQTYLERDVRDILQVGDIEAFGRFLRLCAGRSGQLLNLSSLGVDCGVTHTTARRWLSILEASFVVHLLRPHHKNYSKRLIKSPKLYFVDTGLLCYLLRIRSADEVRSHAARGAIFESFVVSELLKNYVHRGLQPDMYFWRDSVGHEVDIILEFGERLVPLEIKSGETAADDYPDGINYWKTVSRNTRRNGVLVYAGRKSFTRSGVTYCSWQCL